ncbi:hypothetical protein [Caulobacter sp. Root1472]|uniref:hypothetical protein n=1 Tax=Caulobacter sp. Root1472 TaxID=1736470 RepID=UPI0012E34964|nr:hypothetical protein [Caulobacter sp. Root1472]
MSRRYLIRDEVDGALRRGRTVECFLGGFQRDGLNGIRRIALSLVDGTVILNLYESRDFGGIVFLDLYVFGPFDANLELDEPDEAMSFIELEDCLGAMEQRWPGSSGRLVNEGVLQDEYADYVASRSLSRQE